MNSYTLENMYFLQENLISGYSVYILNLLSLISIFCAIYVIITKNPIISVLYLIGLFMSTASYLIIIGINFIGLSYLLIYIGAVSILFIFILMLINIRISELLSNSVNSVPLVIIVTIILNNVLYNTLPARNMIYSILNFNNDYDFSYTLSRFINFTFKNEIFTLTNIKWDSKILEFSNIISLGNIIYTNYSIWLIIASIILLLSMIGAIIITIKQ